MNKYLVGIATAGMVLSGSVAQAQTRGAALEIAPYAGYMLFGNIVEGPLGTSLRASNGRVYGAELGLAITPNIALVANVAQATGELQIGLPIIGGISFADASALMYDGALRLSLPVTTAAGLRVAPFIQGGAGAMRFDLSRSFVETRATNLTVNGAVGADILLTRNIGVSLMAKDYVGTFDFQEASGFDYTTKRAHNWALSAGVKLRF